MRGYWNTNKEEGEELSRSNTKARTQEDHILSIFRRYPQ